MHEVSLFERLMAIGSGLFISLAISALAFRLGYFQRLQEDKNASLSFFDLFSFLMMFLTIKLVIGPATFVAAYFLITHQAFEPAMLADSPELQSAFNGLVILQLVFGFSFYLYLLRPEILPIVFGKTKNPGYEIALGVFSWVVAYPWVFTVNMGMDALIHTISQTPSVEQEAIQSMRGVLNHPYIFLLSFLLVAFIVPVVEEFIFRGFLQQWLKRWLSPWWAIIATAAAFASAHFASVQDFSNIPIISSLFVLSLFLGILARTAELFIGTHRAACQRQHHFIDHHHATGASS